MGMFVITNALKPRGFSLDAENCFKMGGGDGGTNRSLAEISCFIVFAVYPLPSHRRHSASV